MSETYCGKTCQDCTNKEALNCTGCKCAEHGLPAGCELAKCCKEKGHETCDTCNLRPSCSTLAKAADMPTYRQRNIRLEAAARKRKEEEEARKAEKKARLDRNAPILGKWLWLSFWLFVPSMIAGWMASDSVKSMIPSVYWTGVVLGILLDIGRALILLRLACVSQHYKKAGIYGLCTSAVLAITSLLMDTEMIIAALLIALGSLAVSFLAIYEECHAHAEALEDVDPIYAEKWIKLFKWTMWSLAATFLGIFIPLVGVLVVLGGAIAMLVVSILQMVYLYRTANYFREYPSAIPPSRL